jgi:hypothetical protein
VEIKAGSKLTAYAKLAPGSFINLNAAGVKVKPTPAQVKAGANAVEGIELERLDPGQEVTVISVDHPDRLQAAVDRGHLTIK